MTIDLKQLEEQILADEKACKNMGIENYIILNAARAYLAQQKAPEQDVEAMAKLFGDRILCKKLFVCSNDDGTPVKQLYDGIEAAINHALTHRSAPPSEVMDVGNAMAEWLDATWAIPAVKEKFPNNEQTIRSLIATWEAAAQRQGGATQNQCNQVEE